MASRSRGKAPPSGAPSAAAAGRSHRGLVAYSVFAALVFAAPFGYLALRNLASPAALVLAAGAALAPLGRSLLLGGAVALAAAVAGTTAAWVVTRTDVPGRRLWAALLPLPLVIPSFIAAVAFLAAFAPGGLLEGPLRAFGLGRLPELRGFGAAFILLSLITYPYVYLPAAAALDQIPPSLEEAGRILGRRPAEVFRTVVLPQVGPGIVGGGLLTFLYTVSDFGAVQILRYDTLTRVIYATRLLDRGTSLALSLELGAVALAAVVLERRVFGGPRAHRVQRGMHGLRVPLGRWKAPATAFVAALVGLALFAPLCVLGFWAGRGVLRGSTRASALVTDIGGLWGPVVNTAAAGLAAAVLAVAATAPVAYLAVRHPGRVAGMANAVIVAGFALPGLALGLALVYWTLRAPGPIGLLYQTLSLLLFAYVVHFGAQAMGAAQVAVAGVPQQATEAARALGAGPARRLLSVELPLMAPGLLAGGGLVLLSVIKELPATLLLAPPGFQTLATKIWSATEDAFIADASLASLVLVALSAALTRPLVRLGGVPE